MFKSNDATSGYRIYSVILNIFISILFAGWFSTAVAAEDYLEPEQAFQFSAHMVDANTAEVDYAIAKGYYMYRERFQFAAKNAEIGKPTFPPGQTKFDDTFQKTVETYHERVAIMLPVKANGPFTLTVTAQGCADAGLCYAPMTSVLTLSPVGSGTASNPKADATPPFSAAPGETTTIETALQSGRLLVILPLFFLLGLGLSFTPCMLPMMPILSSIIVGTGASVTRRRGLLLSAIYAIGMAIVYTLFGIAAGLAGQGLAASLQNPFVLAGFALLMAVLSLSMFGLYQLQIPAWVQSRLSQVSGKQKSGRLLGVFSMGAISALIVGPCVAAPLAGALLYISQTRNVMIGGSALFSMAVGMSVPLLLIGVSAGTLLPRAGPWMDAVKRFFGVLLLAVALWTVAPLLPSSISLFGWAALGIAYGAYLLRPATGSGWLSKAVGLLLIAFGLAQGAGALTGASDPLAPLASFGAGKINSLHFTRVKSVAELDAKLAQLNGHKAMLDFYADWCVSCKEMEKLTFTDPQIQQQLKDMVVLQADVTANNADDKALMQRFHLFGPPGIIFFDSTGQEIREARVIGYQNPATFKQSLAHAIQ